MGRFRWYRKMVGGHWEQWFYKTKSNEYGLGWYKMAHKSVFLDGAGIMRTKCETHKGLWR